MNLTLDSKRDLLKMDGFEDMPILAAFLFLVIILSAAFAVFILTDSTLSAHPFRLYGWEIFVMAGYYWALYSPDYIQRFAWLFNETYFIHANTYQQKFQQMALLDLIGGVLMR